MDLVDIVSDYHATLVDLDSGVGVAVDAAPVRLRPMPDFVVGGPHCLGSGAVGP